MVQRVSRGTEDEKILNKRKVSEVVKYLVRQKRFIAKHDSWEKEEDLKNAKKSHSKVQRKIECKSTKIGKAEHGRRKRFQKKEVTREIYSENVIQIR